MLSQMTEFLSFLWLNNVPLHIYRNFFIRLFVAGCLLELFCISTRVNKAVRKRGTQI